MGGFSETPNLPSAVLAEQTHLALPSYPHWIEAAVEYLRQKAILAGAVHESRSGKLMLALQEALSNAVVHGNLEVSSQLKEQGDNAFAEALAQRVTDPAFVDRTVDIVVDCGPERCRWLITDEGPGFDVEAVAKKRLSDDPEVLLASGRGMLMISTFVDEMKYELGGRRLVVTMRRDSGVEKRRQTRVASQQPLRVAPILPDGTVDWDAACEAVSRDFSENGARLLLARLTGADRVLIGMKVDNQMLYLPAEVMHCRPLSGDFIELGCRFQAAAEAPGRAGELTEDLTQMHRAVTDLLERHQTQRLPTDERRAHQRVAFNERVEVLVAGAAMPLQGFARDLSKGGIAFIGTASLSGDVTLVFSPQAGAGPVRLRARVVRCVKIQEGFYDVGARFLSLDG